MLEDITKLIADRFKTSPIRIIAAAIYGSWAKGTQTTDSDIDIMLISKDVNPKKHRRGEEIAAIKRSIFIGSPVDILLLTPDECISNFRNHNPLFLDIACEGIIVLDADYFLRSLVDETRAYISQKKLERLPDGWRFPVLYREPTFLSSVSNKDFAIVMLTDGERDFEIGVYIMGKGYCDKAVYHFQQAAEKAVKAVLISLGEFKRTHFVGEILLNVLKDKSLENDWKERLCRIAEISSKIEPEVTWSRYPGIDNGQLWTPYEEYTTDDAVAVKKKSEEVLMTAKDFIKWWFKL